MDTHEMERMYQRATSISMYEPKERDKYWEFHINVESVQQARGTFLLLGDYKDSKKKVIECDTYLQLQKLLDSIPNSRTPKKYKNKVEKQMNMLCSLLDSEDRYQIENVFNYYKEIIEDNHYRRIFDVVSLISAAIIIAANIWFWTQGIY